MENTEKIVGVPKQVFEKFLDDLKEKGISEEIIARLGKTIFDDGRLTDKALREAIIPKE